MESGIIKEEIKKLLDKYNRVLQEKEVSKYNEEMTKKDFYPSSISCFGLEY